jgi:cAMP-dependent protein kinase regulator
MYESFLNSVPLLSGMEAYERSQVADALKAETFSDGDAIVKEGEDGNKFYVLEAGNAVATKGGDEVKSYTPGDYFGELALLKNQPRAATVTCKGNVKVLVLDRPSFKRLLGPQDALLRKYADQYK